MSGVILVSRKISVFRAIEEILIVSECSLAEDWEGVVDYLAR